MSERLDIEAKKCLTPKFRASYVNVFQGQKNDDGEIRYTMTMIFPKSVSLKDLQKAATNAVVEKYGPDKKKWPPKLKMPFRDGDVEKPDRPEYANSIFVACTSKQRPGVIDRNKAPISEEDKAFYSGCYARAKLIAFCYDIKGNKGVSFALQNILKVADGEAFSGRKSAEEDFADVEVDDEEGSGAEVDDDMGF